MSASSNHNKRLLLVAPKYSYRIAAYVRAAKQLGITIQIASDGKHSLVSELADGLHIDLDAPQAAVDVILADAHRHDYAAVIATDDRCVTLAARIATALGLTHNDPRTAQISRRKDLSRAHLQQSGLPVPEHQLLLLDRPLITQLGGIRFPCVVKPLSLSASTGVIRADNVEELLAACDVIRPIIGYLHDPEERQQVLVERYIDGTEVAVEGMVTDGQFQLLALFDKPGDLHGPYFEETYYVTPSRLPPESQKRIEQRVGQACTALGFVSGPVHAELRVDKVDAWILEVASRTIGGDCGKMMEFIYPYSLETLIVANALGQPLPAPMNDQSAGVMMIPTPKAGILRRIEGLLDASAVPYIQAIDIAVKDGHELICLPQGSSYLGFIFARAPTPTLTENALRQAFGKLNIVVGPLWKIGSTS